MSIQTIISGAISPETAYLIDDYPYGFRLRCKIRYWLEYKPGKGHRLWSQTSNPKRPGLVWNKPKASTFQRFGGCMYLDERGHVHWTGLNEYDSVKECVDWRDKFGSAMEPEAQQFLKAWITRKLAFEQAKSEGQITYTTTCQQYTPMTEGLKPIGPPEIKSEVLTSEHTPDELAAMGQTLRAPIAGELAKLTPEPVK